jgi:hypothetical protein
MQDSEPEPRGVGQGDFREADVSRGRTQEVHADVDEPSKAGLDSAGYLRGWRLHLVSLRSVTPFQFSDRAMLLIRMITVLACVCFS